MVRGCRFCKSRVYSRTVGYCVHALLNHHGSIRGCELGLWKRGLKQTESKLIAMEVRWYSSSTCGYLSEVRLD